MTGFEIGVQGKTIRAGFESGGVVSVIVEIAGGACRCLVGGMDAGSASHRWLDTELGDGEWITVTCARFDRASVPVTVRTYEEAARHDDYGPERARQKREYFLALEKKLKAKGLIQESSDTAAGRQNGHRHDGT